MKKFCLLIAISIFAIASINVAWGQGRPMSNFVEVTIPVPFNEIEQQDDKTQAAASTGYYFMDSRAFPPPGQDWSQWKPGPRPDGMPSGLLPSPMHANPFEPTLWFRVYSGPRQVPQSEVESGYDATHHVILPPGFNPNIHNINNLPPAPREGYRYFRNPADHARYLNREDTGPGIDTVRHAIAGPIPIGFPFYKNGIRYDSFYVSARGIIALTNRRYFYNNDGARIVPFGKNDCYDEMSADWGFNNGVAWMPGNPAPNQGRIRTYENRGLNDPTPDNYGWSNVVLGGNPTGSRTAGIRNFQLGATSMQTRLNNNAVAGAAYISPMEGPFYLPQWNERTNSADDWGQVWYKRSMFNDVLVIYFRNLQMDSGRYQQNHNSFYNLTNGRPWHMNLFPEGDVNVLSGSVQVELNRIDSSITFRYGEFYGRAWRYITAARANAALANPHGQPEGFIPAAEIIQTYANRAIGGFARHTGYDTKNPETRPENSPWAGQYMQVTQLWRGLAMNPLSAMPDIPPQGDHDERILNNSYQIKFKQWRNSLRLATVQYFVRKKEPDAIEFTDTVRTADVLNDYNPFELLAGHAQLGEMQPVALIQNLTNDIQGPNGVNFVPQDFQFQARLLIRNRVTDRYVYNRSANVSEFCLNLGNGQQSTLCGSDPFASVRFVKVNNNHNVIETLHPLPDGVNGIPSYGFAYVAFPRYRPNEFIQEQIGLMEVIAVTQPINPNTNFNFGDEWPFDDSSRIDFWVINRLREFKCNSDFHNLPGGGGQVPNIGKWVYARWGNTPSVQVVRAGDQSSNHPLPPLGNIWQLNDAIEGESAIPLISPMIRTSWSSVGGRSVGSKITSFPIDMRARRHSVVTLAVQRGVANMDTDRGFSDRRLPGPEARVVFNNAGTKIDMAHTAAILTAASLDPDFDYLAVEYLRPSINGVKHITMTGPDSNANDNFTIQHTVVPPPLGPFTPVQVLNDRWRFHPYWANGAIQNNAVPITANINAQGQLAVTARGTVQNAPALAIFGGGGHFVGWSFADGRTYWPANWNAGVWATNDLHGGSGVTLYVPDQNPPYANTLPGIPVVGIPGTGGNQNNIVGGLVFNPYDVGFDFEFHRYSVSIPDYYIEDSPVIGPDAGRNFRFRIRMIETNAIGGNGDNMNINPGNPSDDGDVFLVDNVAIAFGGVSKPDIEAASVKVVWPYYTVPASQANDMSIIARINNMGTANTVPFTVKVRAFRGQFFANDQIPNNQPIYCRTTTVPQLLAGNSMELAFPGFNPRDFALQNNGTNTFTLQLIVNYPGKDLDSLNDTTLSVFILRFGDVFAYTNEVANKVDEAAGVTGKGLNLLGTSFSGYNAAADPQLLSTPRYTPPAGVLGTYYRIPNYGLPFIDWVAGGSHDPERPGHPYYGPLSGKIAMKFELTNADTLRGLRVIYTAANQAADDISIHIHNNRRRTDGVDLPNNELTAHGVLPLYARRMHSKAANGVESATPIPVGSFVQYEFSTPIRLERGTYWISIAQRGQTGLELAATDEAMGMRTMLVQSSLDDIGGAIGEQGILGERGIQIMADPRFRMQTAQTDAGKRRYINNNVFAYSNILGSNRWEPFMPTSGHVAYAHLDHWGVLPPSSNNYRTFTRGTWAPIMRPVFGLKQIQADTEFYPCPDDDPNLPTSIEIADFEGYQAGNKIDLLWETYTEVNNDWFILERSNINDGIWEEIWKEKGAGNSSTPRDYKYSDFDVVSGNTYQYRLYNIDFDGNISCQNNNIVTVEYNLNTSISLEQNKPNPFSNGETHIGFVIPEAQTVTLEIVDIFGRTVKTLIDNEVLVGPQNRTWNGTDENNMRVANGSYLYRLTTGSGEVLTKKMTFIKSN